MSTSFVQDTLIAEYVSAREDGRNLEGMRVNLIGFILASLTVLGAIATRDCRIVNQPGECSPIPDAFLALSPLVPTALLANLTVVSITIVLKSFDLRRIEADIREQLPGARSDIMRWEEIEVEANRMLRRRGVMRPLSLIAQITAAVIFGGYTLVVFSVVSVEWRVVMGVIFGTAFGAILNRAIVAGADGRRMYHQLLDGAASAESVRERRSPTTTTSALIRYHVLPRVGIDSLNKGLFVIAGGVIALMTQAPAGQHDEYTIALQFAVVVLAVEILLYQARYLLNDIRGFSVDAGHPHRQARRRLASVYDVSESSKAVKAALLNIAARLGLYLVLTYLVEASLAIPLRIAAVAVLVLAVLYDTSRDLTPRTPQGKRRVAAVLHVLVGGGYAIRVTVGYFAFTTIVGGVPDLRVTVLLAVFFWCLGSFFVSLTWAFEATTFVDERLVARGLNPSRVHVDPALWAKPHVAQHLVSLGLSLSPSTYAGGSGRRGAGSRVLASGDRFAAIRAIPTQACGIGAVAWAVGLTNAGLVSCVVMGLLMSGATFGLWRSGKTARVWSAVSGTLCLLLFCRLQQVVGASPAGIVPIIVAAAPWILFCGVNLAFRSSSYEELYYGPRKVGDAVQGLLLRSLHLLTWVVVGRSASTALRSPGTEGASSRPGDRG